MRYFAVCALLGACGMASAAGVPCSIHLTHSTPPTDLLRFTKVSMVQARATALSSLGAPSATVAEGELEVEAGCLIYSFDVHLPRHRNTDEVWVDPGTGKVLSHTQETPAQQSAERAQDAAELLRRPHAGKSLVKAPRAVG